MMNVTPTNWKKIFIIIWTGQAFSLIGSQMIHFAIAWWVTSSTGSAAVLATMAILSLTPQVILGPFIGVLVDRWNRRMVMIIADGLIALVTLWLAVMFLTGRAEIWFLYVTALVRGTMGVFHWTAMQASTSLMVPRDQLARVSGLNQTLQGILNIAAPPLGALLVGLLPIGGIMLIDVATAAIAITPLLLIRIPQPKNVSTEVVTLQSVWRDAKEGVRYVASWPAMVIILLMATVINFLMNPTGTLTPLLITKHFGGGVWHLGAMESSWGVGFIAGGLLLSVWGGFRKRIVTIMAGLIAMGAAILVTGFAPPDFFWLAVAGNILAAVINPLVNGPLFAILQARVAPEMQGRVFTLVGSIAGAMAPLGMALAAPVADHLGIQVWWWFGGGMCILMGITGFLIPAVMRVEEDPAHAAVSSESAAQVEPAAQIELAR